MEDDNDNGNDHNSEMALTMKEISWKAKAMIKAIMIIKINSEQLKQIAMQFQSTGNNINCRGTWIKVLSDFW